MVALLFTSGVVAEEKNEDVFAFPDKIMLRSGAYFVDGTRTQFSINSTTGGLGTTLDYSKDLGGEKRETIPRLDAYYRFNDRHRIDFTSFSINRDGVRELAVDPPLQIGDETFTGETLNSSIKYTLYKLGYVYSFYHSPKVELGISAGLNITSYDMDFSNAAGDKAEAVGITAPLPVFGLRMKYMITPEWSIGYLVETFAIEIDNFRGSLFNYELNTEYRLLKNFSLGIGLARLGMNVEVDEDDWRGTVSDSYRGFTAFGVLYF